MHGTALLLHDPSSAVLQLFKYFAMLFNPIPNLPFRLGISDLDVVSLKPTTRRATLMVSLKFSAVV